MYKMVGADGKEYGPISADQLRQWIVEGRANGQTRVLPEGSTEWKPLAEISEFAQALPGFQTTQQISTPQSVSATPQNNGMAVASLVLGILSMTCGICCCGFPLNLLGIVFALIALSQISADPISQRGRGMAITGLVLCILSIFGGILLHVLVNAMNGQDFWRKMNL